MWREEDHEMPTTELPHALATRFVALDVHRQYLMVGAVDIQQHVVLSPRRFGCAAFAQWATTHVTHADAVVLEATSNLLAANLIPAVWVPPQAVRELRALVTHRNRLVQQRTQAANRLHSVLYRHILDPPPGTPKARPSTGMVA